MSPSLISLDAWLQAEKKRIDKLNKGLAERTIDAQRVSGAQTGSPGAPPHHAAHHAAAHIPEPVPASATLLAYCCRKCAGMCLQKPLNLPGCAYARVARPRPTLAYDPPTPLSAATVPRDTVQLYQQLRESGLQYGPAFRCGACNACFRAQRPLRCLLLAWPAAEAAVAESMLQAATQRARPRRAEQLSWWQACTHIAVAAPASKKTRGGCQLYLILLTPSLFTGARATAHSMIDIVFPLQLAKNATLCAQCRWQRLIEGGIRTWVSAGPAITTA